MSGGGQALTNSVYHPQGTQGVDSDLSLWPEECHLQPESGNPKISSSITRDPC